MKIKGKVVPVALAAILGSPFAIMQLVQLEGNIKRVYADHLAGGVPTYCAGRTDPDAVVGTLLTDDQCNEINKMTLMEYGVSALGCTTWDNLTPNRLLGLTLFSINVGKSGACGSQSFKAINAGRVAEGCDLLARKPDGRPNWSNSGGRYRQGLQNRRQAERALCLEDIQP